MHQPSKTNRQTVQTVIDDLEAQRVRLADAVTWMKNITKGIENTGKHIQFTNAGPIEANSREAGIAFHMLAGGQMQDVLVFTIVSTPSESDLAAMRRESAMVNESLRLANLLNWQSQGVRVFETWFVPEPTVWQGSPELTQVFLVKTVKAWLSYWFEKPSTPVFRPRNTNNYTALPLR